MVLLMVVTVIYAPVVVPLAVAGATVEAWDIASSLIVLLLIPLGLGLFAKARSEELVGALVIPIVLIVLAGELGKRLGPEVEPEVDGEAEAAA